MRESRTLNPSLYLCIVCMPVLDSTIAVSSLVIPVVVQRDFTVQTTLQIEVCHGVPFHWSTSVHCAGFCCLLVFRNCSRRDLPAWFQKHFLAQLKVEWGGKSVRCSPLNTFKHYIYFLIFSASFLTLCFFVLWHGKWLVLRR